MVFSVSFIPFSFVVKTNIFPTMFPFANTHTQTHSLSIRALVCVLWCLPNLYSKLMATKHNAIAHHFCIDVYRLISCMHLNVHILFIFWLQATCIVFNVHLLEWSGWKRSRGCPKWKKKKKKERASIDKQKIHSFTVILWTRWNDRVLTESVVQCQFNQFTRIIFK